MAQDGDRQVQMAMPAPAKLLTPGVVTLLVLMLAGCLLYEFRPAAVNLLTVTPVALFALELWRLLTYPFVTDILGLIGAGLVVVFLGSAMEREWRTGSFLLFCAVVTAASGLIWIAAGVLFGLMCGYVWPAGAGTSALSYGLIAAFGMMNRGRRFMVFFGTMEAQHLAWLIIGIGVLMCVRAPAQMVWVSGAAVAYVYLKLLWDRSLPFTTRQPRRTGRFEDL